MAAAVGSHAYAMQRLLEDPRIDPTAPWGSQGFPPLHWAAQAGDCDAMGVLLGEPRVASDHCIEMHGRRHDALDAAMGNICVEDAEDASLSGDRLSACYRLMAQPRVLRARLRRSGAALEDTLREFRSISIRVDWIIARSWWRRRAAVLARHVALHAAADEDASDASQ